MMNIRALKKKLYKASIKDDCTKGYGGSPLKYIDPLLPWFKLITYRKGPFLVVDRYTGEEFNIGQAITFFRKRPMYGTNYYGILIDNKLKVKIVFSFLKKALLAGAGKSTHRGLDGYKENSFRYSNKFTEKRGFTEGEEKIFNNNKLVYIQVYHGGIIRDSRTRKDWMKNLLRSKNLLQKLKF
jgi:hypothetical protein